MMPPDPVRPRSPLFLQRRSYRRRRVMDGARVLPILGLLLWAVPLLWPDASGEAVTSSGALLYIFGVWITLVLMALCLSIWLRRGEEGAERGE